MAEEMVEAKELVLVVGAGASKEARLPVGSELKTHIAAALNIRYRQGYQRTSGDELIVEALRHIVVRCQPREDINSYLSAARRVSDAMPQAISIDNFIDSHRGEEKISICGKLAIARCILQSESHSSLYVNREARDSRIDFVALQPTWFNSFFQLLTVGCQRDEIATRLSKIAVVCFNYDRCIEHYLHLALQNYYGIAAEDATAALSALNIYHPYGVAGHLPWQEPLSGVGFGSDPAATKLIQIAQQLRTFTEGIDPATSDIEDIRGTLRCARRLVFLGFAFHPLNLQLLFPSSSDGQRVHACKVFGTALGISDVDIEAIRSELVTTAAVSREDVHLKEGLSCAGLFGHFQRSLSIY